MAVDYDQFGKQMAREVMQYFFVPFQGNTFFRELDSLIAKLPSDYRSVAKAFKHNLQSVISTVSVPVALAMASAQSSRFRELHIAEKIRARKDLGPDGQPTAEALRSALEIARKRMGEEITSPEGLNHLADTTSSFLLSTYDDESIKQAAAELLRQGVVLVWGAFEVLARGIFVAYMNANPACAQKLADDPVTKRLFDLKGFGFETLAAYGYDVSRNMGNILASLNDVSSLAALKDVFQVILPKHLGLREKLNSKELWLLAQRRHLIVHRRSIIDEKYLRSSGDTVPKGDTLNISPRDIENCLFLVRDAGHELLNSLTTES
jgi:hypothetical protein